MKQRIIQLSAKYLGMLGAALAGKAYADLQPDTLADIMSSAEVLVGGFTAIGGIALDLFLHRLGVGSVLKPAGG